VPPRITPTRALQFFLVFPFQGPPKDFHSWLRACPDYVPSPVPGFRDDGINEVLAYHVHPCSAIVFDAYQLSLVKFGVPLQPIYALESFGIDFPDFTNDVVPSLNISDHWGAHVCSVQIIVVLGGAEHPLALGMPEQCSIAKPFLEGAIHKDWMF